MGRKSLSHEGRVGRHKGSFYTKSKAYMAETRLVGAIGAGGVISSEEELPATRGKRFLGMEECLDLHTSPKDTSNFHNH